MHTHLSRSFTVGAAVLGLSVGAPAVAIAAPSAPSHYVFTTLGDHQDPTFNQLLGINDHGQIAGYFGIGTSATVHPNRGYVINPPHHQANFVNENFPGAAQTQVIGINDSGTTVGFFADNAGDNFGFVRRGGIFTKVVNHHTGAGTVNQLLGLNNRGVAVGFYNDAQGHSHGYEFNFHTGVFSGVHVPGATSVTAAGINNQGDVTGFFVNSAGNTRSFLRLANGTLLRFSAPGSTNTTAFGLNNHDEIVGAYATGSGTGAATHGFVWNAGTLRTVDDPHGQGTTLINGVNNNGRIVGFYTDALHHVDGFVAFPA